MKEANYIKYSLSVSVKQEQHHGGRVVGVDQSWLKKGLNIMNIIMVLIMFYGNVFHYYIHDIIIIKQTYDSSI